jgi:hypothetical protein
MSRDCPSLDDIYGVGAEQADDEAAACEDAMNRAYDRGASAEQIIAALDSIQPQQEQSMKAGRYIPDSECKQGKCAHPTTGCFGRCYIEQHPNWPAIAYMVPCAQLVEQAKDVSRYAGTGEDDGSKD